LSWQRHNGCHFVSFVIYISGAKFQEHCFNISRDILDWVLNCLSGTTYDVITYNTKTWISLKRKKIFQKGKRHSSLLWKAFQISRNYFYFIGTLSFKLFNEVILLKTSLAEPRWTRTPRRIKLDALSTLLRFKNNTFSQTRQTLRIHSTISAAFL